MNSNKRKAIDENKVFSIDENKVFSIDENKVFSVLYRKRQFKMHKTWDGDGYVVERNQKLFLLNQDGKELGSIAKKPLVEEEEIIIGGKEVQIQNPLTKWPDFIEKHLSAAAPAAESASAPLSVSKVFVQQLSGQYYRAVYRVKPTTKKHKTWDGDGYALSLPDNQTLLLDSQGKEISKSKCMIETEQDMKIGGKECKIIESITKEVFDREISSDVHTKTDSEVTPAYKQLVRKSDPIKLKPFKPVTSRLGSNTLKLAAKFDPTKKDALIMPRPLLENVIDVVVDPFIAKHLKDYQKEGVTFLYECCMGLRSSDYQGCLLADDMGLGKSLQAITLIWTLLKQTPHHPGKVPVCQKVLLVCPASLMTNWAKEFKKWLGDARIKVLIVKQDVLSIREFVVGRKYQVLIINYEKVKKFQKDIIDAKFDLIVCDEGHRLKNSDNQCSQVLSQISTKRRVILSGTPLQNDLLEFHTMFDFVNPGMIGSVSEFKKRFLNPISKGRSSDASPNEQKAGQQKLEELLAITSKFILRRTGKENSQFLPCKSTFVLFVKPSPLQATKYQQEIQNVDLDSLGSDILSKMTRLRKLATFDGELDAQIRFKSSSKFSLVASMLSEFQSLDEKVVIVSHWTKVLDEIQTYLQGAGTLFLRLDGAVSSSKRQGLVDDFNDSSKNYSCFLLSSKAGGVGLNLIGASRLIMIDIDWNPATDAQAMARIWRHGQRKPCFIYRLIGTGTIEEFIYKRQISKVDLSSSVIEQDHVSLNTFSKQDLNDIFTFDQESDSVYHDSLCKGVECACEGHLSRHLFATIGEEHADFALQAVCKTFNDKISFIEIN